MKELKPELKAIILYKAGRYTQFCDEPVREHGAYVAGATVYALKWQQAEEMMEKMRLALTMTVFALKQSYDVTEYPANGETEQDSGIRVGEQALAEYKIYKNGKDGTVNG